MRLKIKKTGKFKNSKKYLKLINNASVYDVAIDSPTTHAVNLSFKEKNNIYLKEKIFNQYSLSKIEAHITKL